MLGNVRDSTSTLSSESMDSTSRQSSESVEIRANRLLSGRERERALHASETAEQKEKRLRKGRMRDKAKRATKTLEERAAALQQRRERQTSKTEEQRERPACMQRMRANRSERMAAGTELEHANMYGYTERHTYDIIVYRKCAQFHCQCGACSGSPQCHMPYIGSAILYYMVSTMVL